MKLHDERRLYNLSSLNENEVPANPFSLFSAWYDLAKNTEGILEPNIMTLATATIQAKPSARIVLLKEVNNEGFVFFTNYHSRKGKEISHNPQAELLFFWDRIEKQIRIEGTIKKISTAASEAYFYSRPIESQYGAMASPQSSVITKEKLEENLVIAQNEKPVRPENWGGYVLQPNYFEFWQGRPSRLHDRIIYVKNEENWQISRLAP